MALGLHSAISAPILDIDTIDSTNNYAMQLIDADTALPGMTILAQKQTAGKGQRGRVWQDAPGQSVLMSLIVTPVHSMEEQFLFNASAIVGIADVLQHLNENWDVRIKWPNDIMLNDKKAGGVLIENVLRGNIWAWSVIGVGLNVLQETLDPDLLFATSLKIVYGKNYNVRDVAIALRNEMLQNLNERIPSRDIMQRYNDYLFRRGARQKFYDDYNEWMGTVVEASPNGQLMVQLQDGSLAGYTHGTVNWKWE